MDESNENPNQEPEEGSNENPNQEPNPGSDQEVTPEAPQPVEPAPVEQAPADQSELKTDRVFDKEYTVDPDRGYRVKR